MSEQNFQLPVGDPTRERIMSVGVRLAVSVVIGLVTMAVAQALASWKYVPLAGWDTAAIVFLVWVWLSIKNRDAQATANLAVREDPGRAVADILLVLASVASLAAVAVLLFQASNAPAGVAKLIESILGIVSVVISWAMVHTIYTLRYARLFYKNKGGIDFNSRVPPQYSDFAYVSFTIGMTFQVSDNNFTNNEFRRVALRHALLSYLFGAIILALTVNLIVGLGK
jgi:uncharacterized membrane protein